VRAVVNCRAYELLITLQLLVVTICKGSTNPITNPDPVYSHYIRDNIIFNALDNNYAYIYISLAALASRHNIPDGASNTTATEHTV
jgi:NADH:ubiquinone oxidoreductase subunit H